MNRNNLDEFHCQLFEFMADLHDCHGCKCVLRQINGRGKQRTFCDKYKMPVQRVRWQCIDRYPGFSDHELRAINRQYLRGECKLVVNGVEIKYEEKAA